MARLETNLSKKDKMTIAGVLGFALVFMFAWFVIRPMVISINELEDSIKQARSTQTLYKNKIINLNSAQSAFDMVTSDLYESTSDYYELMPSSQIDQMATNYVLGFGLFPEDLYITMPSGPVEEFPYIYSLAAQRQASAQTTPAPTPTPIDTSLTAAANTVASEVANAIAQPEVVDSLLVPYGEARAACNTTSASAVECAGVSITVTGSPEQCQAMLDDLCTKPSLRVVGFTWDDVEQREEYNEETGEVEIIESDMVRLTVDLRFYMVDVTDYQAEVSAAVETAVAEG